MIKASPFQVRNFIVDCIKRGKPYRDHVSNSRHTIKSGKLEVVTAAGMLPAHELFFIKQIREDIIKYKLDKEIPKRFKKQDIRKEIIYYQYNKNLKVGQTVENLVEIDLNAAYFQMAYRLGLVTDQMYKRAMPITWDEALALKVIGKVGFKKLSKMTPEEALEQKLITKKVYDRMNGISKKTRLAAIGSLAKKTRDIYFTGKRWYVLHESRDPLAYLWDAICWNVSQIMQEAAKAAGKDFVFYWVDAIIVKKEAEEKVRQVFEKHAYHTKKFKIEKVVVTEKELIVHSKEKSKRKIIEGVESMEDRRTFPYAKDNKI